MDDRNLHTEEELENKTDADIDETVEATDETVEEKSEKPKSRPGQSLYEWSQALAISVCAIVLIFTFFARIIGVDGDSMNPTLIDKDKMLMVSSMFCSYEQGDIVVLYEDSFENPLVKRIIATEGQTIRFEPSVDYSSGSVLDVYVDGVKLDEDYIAEPIVRSYNAEVSTDIVIPEGCVYVMGDNRNHSSDSRSDSVGPVDERQIIGKAVWRVFPIGSFGGL